MQRMIREIVAGRDFDLIQIEDNAMAGYQYPATIPRVLTDHEVRRRPEEAWSVASQMSLLRRSLEAGNWRRWHRYQRMVWRQFDRVQVFTPRDAATVGTLAPELLDRVRVNPFGIDLPPVARPELEESDTVAFVGGFAHPPNVDAALWLGGEIMPQLRLRRPGCHLYIVGSQPPPAVRALAAADITVSGDVPAVEPFLERASVVVAPLRQGGGMRLKVLQAMALGKAVVTTPLGAEGLMTTPLESPLVTGETAEEIVTAVAQLLGHAASRRCLGQQARAFVEEHHTWPAYAQRLDAIYAEIRAQAPGPTWHRPRGRFATKAYWYLGLVPRAMDLPSRFSCITTWCRSCPPGSVRTENAKGCSGALAFARRPLY